MVSNTMFRTNASPLKRSFAHLAPSADPASCHEDPEKDRQYVERRSLSFSSSAPIQQHYRPAKRRTASTNSMNSMHVQSTTIMSASFPSFMSVFGSEDANIYNHAASEHNTKSGRLTFPQFASNTNHITFEPQPAAEEHRSSLTSTPSCSTESSPTTTSSTFDSPVMADKSPDSSPESASSAAPPKSFQQPRMRSAGTQTMDFPGEKSTELRFQPAPLPSLESPKKNLKKLTLNMELPSLMRPNVGSDESLPFSAPTSPLRESLRTGRRKPNNLTIRTPGFNQLSFGANTFAVPATPGQKPMLHQAQSSPSLQSLNSPALGPAGGMRLTLPNIAQHLKRDSVSSVNGASQPANLPSLREEPYQPPKSQEAPERGYTDGPCLIYDSGVYLYLEPTAEEASKFDTVINVAKEIKNPFETPSSENNTVVSIWRNAGNRQSMVEPQTAMSEISFKSAFEWPSGSESASPTTPKAGSGSQFKKPEYLHVKWDHNSEILDDLYPLCRLIDDRVQQGKKVLIHCQLGVSRSASLIIAYGLYKGMEADFHSMYMAVKKRSQWVGPNMSLIYQLTDYKAKCDQGTYINSSKQLKQEWFIYGPDNTAAPKDGLLPVQKADRTTPPEQPTETKPVLRLNKELPPVPLFPKWDAPKASRASLGLNEAEPVRQPPSQVAQSTKPAKRPVPRVLPFRAMGYSSQQMTIPPHKPRAVPGLTHAQPSMDLAMQDVPAVPSLFSPRATEFMATPFGVTTAGDLVTTTPKSVKPPPGAFPGGTEWRNSLFLNQATQAPPIVPEQAKPLTYDPRSPHQLGESKGIFRNIDGFL